MESKKLRIGNWVTFICDEGTLNVQMPLVPETLDCKKYKPIPIDGEWLLALGFTYYSENKSYQLDSDFGFSIWGMGKVVNMTSCCDSEFGRDIKFVHDLQNVWFSLIGKELERIQ